MGPELVEAEGGATLELESWHEPQTHDVGR